MNRQQRQISTTLINLSILIFAAAVLIAQLFTPDSYCWSQNTVSELAAQNYANHWIMQAGLLGFGGMLTVGVGLRWRERGRFWHPDLLLLVYAMAIFLTGVFATTPFESGQVYNEREVQLHSFFASTAGFAITIAMFWYGWIARSPGRKAFHFACFALVLLLSALFGLADNGALEVGTGVVQRALHAAGLIWLMLQTRLYKTKHLSRRLD